MKVVHSSSPTLLHIMIPQFHQLLPVETTISGSWNNPSYTTEQQSMSNKALSPPVSVTPSSICTDLSEGEYHSGDLSATRKYSISTPPLSNIKVESTDLSDGGSTNSKQETTNVENQIKFASKTMKHSNFTIEYLLSTNFPPPPTFYYLNMSKISVQSIFNKKKVKHFSDHYLHRIVHKRRPIRLQDRPIKENRHFLSPRGIFISYIFDLIKDFINEHKQIEYQENLFKIDALEQLAEIACKLDARQQPSMFNDDKITKETYQKLLKQSHSLIKTITQKNHQKKLPKRLHDRSSFDFKRHMVYFATCIRNLLQIKKKFILDQDKHSVCQVSNVSDNEEQTETCCSHITSDQIVTDLEILVPNDGLLYEATIQTIEHFDDLFLIRLNHERQTYLLPTADLCRLACPKIIPTDFDMLKKNKRVCAFWSTSLRGLHPAVVKNIPSDVDNNNEQFHSSMVNLLFDDGDTGLIKLDEIRLLPPKFAVQGIRLEEWRVSSFQIPTIVTPSQRNSRRVSSSSTTRVKNSTGNSKKLKISSKTIRTYQWTLNTRNSTIIRDDNKEILRKGDCVILHGVNQSLSYIGKVLRFYRDRETQQDLVRLQWYYSPQETPRGQNEDDLNGALYESTHIDVNPISTIRSKGVIHQSYDDYVKRTNYGKQRQDNDFYLVGQYDPVSGVLQRYDHRSKA